MQSSGFSYGGISGNHDSILQTLDEVVNGLYMDSNSFEDVDWSGVPLIYSPYGIHPDLDAYAINAVEALKKINGRIVGKVLKSEFIRTGQPRLEGTFTIDDPELTVRARSGLLYQSTAFFHDAVESEGVRHIVGKIQPHHLLLFPKNSGALPADGGSFVLNSESVAKKIAEQEKKIKALKEENKVLNSALKWGADLMEKAIEEKKPKITIGSRDPTTGEWH